MESSTGLPNVIVEGQPHLEKRRLDLEDIAERLREEKIPQHKDQLDTIIEKVNSHDEWSDYEDVDPEVRARAESIESSIAALKKNHDKFLWLAYGADIDAWPTQPYYPDSIDQSSGFTGWGSHPTFTLQELSGAHLSLIADTVSEDADIDIETGTANSSPNPGKNMVLSVYLSLLDTPTEAPDDPREYPAALLKYLFEQVNELNGEGDADEGNSLRDAMT